jgi:copper(I)-binding protein
MRLFALATLSALSLFAGSITVEKPFVKEVAPNMQNSAAFMTIKNSSDKNISLISANSDVCKITELHTHGHQNGMMAMYRVDKIDVPAHGEALLKPMGYHVMLIGLTRPIKEGENVTIDLKFSDGEIVKVSAPVKKLQGAMKPIVDNHQGTTPQ